MPGFLDGLVPARPGSQQPQVPTGIPAVPSAQTPAAPTAVTQPTVMAPSAPVMRDFADPSAVREAIHRRVFEAARNLKAAENNRYRLAVENLAWADPDRYSLAKQKQAILGGETLARRIRGDYVLYDKATGQPVTRKTATVARVPWYTPRGTFIMNGTEYILNNQMRLRSGVFTRQQENGELESHINVIPGKGMSHRYHLEPESGVFRLSMGQGSVPLITLLRAVGWSDKELSDAWGKELFRQNALQDDPKAIDKLYAKLVRNPEKDISPEEKRKVVVEKFGEMELDPEVTKRTLGKDFRKLDREAMLETTKKLLKVARGEAEEDDRDHLAYQHFMGPEDLLSEGLTRDRQMLSQLLWKATHKGNLDRIPTGAFTKLVEGGIFDSGLGQAAEEINALDILDGQTRVSRMGRGAIGSVDAIPDSARSVQASQLGYIDLVRTAESLRAGVDLRVGWRTRKGDDGKIYTPFIDPKTNQEVWKAPQDIADLTIAFPGVMNSNKPLVEALVKGKPRLVPREKVDVVLPHMENAFSALSNLVPLKSMSKGQRVSMGSRFLTQSLSLENPEAPLVQTRVPGTDQSYEEYYGRFAGVVRGKEKVGGRVQKVTPDGITVKYDDGSTEEHELYNHTPYNRKSYLHNTPLVKEGDRVEPNQLLARSNFTDEKGTIALGKNLRVAYMPIAGNGDSNYEDAFAISETAAKQLLRSEHAYQHFHEWSDQHKRGKKNFIGIFPTTYDKATLDTLDDDGVVKPGTVIKAGSPLIVMAKERELSHKQVHASHKGAWSDASITWDHHNDGIVTDAVKTDKGVNVLVKSISPTQVGDKISSLHGDKGIVNIIPDDRMPTDENGQPFHVLANPLGIISRLNPSQIALTMLGKIAAKTGKPYKIEDFPSDIEDMTEWVRNEAKKHGVSETETVIDPVSGKKIPNVFTGVRYYVKLHHSSEGKSSARGLGSYTSEGVPARGSGEAAQAKKVAVMDVNSLLSHGAIEVIRDNKLIRGNQNLEFWTTFMSGDRPATPDVPFVYKKFIEQLRGSGVHLERKGSRTHIMALTDKHINELCGDRELKNAETVSWKDGMKPIPGGLFDPGLTGGHSGQSRWAKITLNEPLPSPVMEEPIRRVLGLTSKAFEAVLAGKQQIDGKTGAKAIHAALSKLNVDREIAKCRADIQSGRKTARETAIRKLGFLKGCKDQGIQPADWMIKAAPVLPPIFRPVSVMQGSGGTLVADMNYLYKDLFDANQVNKELHSQLGDAGEDRLTLYNALKAVVGLGDPVNPKHVEKRIQGLLANVFNSAPKTSFLQQKLIGTPVNTTARGVVAPDPDLHMDEVGIPENQAWTVYSPFLVRNLVRKGVGRTQALEYIEKKHDLARKALIEEMGSSPILLTRAPVLHRFGHMAFWPKLIKGDTIKVSPPITAGFGMDFDGDQQIGQVIVSCADHNQALKWGGSYPEFWQDRRMSLQAKQRLGLFQQGEFYLVDLSEFPHTDTFLGCSENAGFFAVPKGVQVVAYDEETKQPVLADVAAWSIHTERKVVLVELQSGRQIITDDDPRAVYGFDLETYTMVRRRPSEAIGLFVPRVEKLPELFDNTITEIDGGEGRRVFPKWKLTRRLGQLLGLLVGDGWVSQSTGSAQTHLAAADDGVAARFRDVLDEVFIDPPTVSKNVREAIEGEVGYCVRYTVSSNEFSRRLNQLIGTGVGQKSRDKHLPSFFLSAPYEFRLGLLEGLLDTDGSVSISGGKAKPQLMVNFSSTCIRLIEEVQQLLRSLSVISRITPSKTPKGLPFWMLNLSTIDIPQLELSLSHTGKAHALQAAPTPDADNPGTVRHDVIPFPPGVAITLRRVCPHSKIETRKLYHTLTDAIEKGSMSRWQAKKLIEYLGSEQPDTEHWKTFRAMVEDTSTRWDKVVEVTPTDIVEIGYDLTVPGYETFMATTGVVLSNTSTWHVPVSEEARKEAAEKMLPSRNLFSVGDFKSPMYSLRQEFMAGAYDLSTAKNDKPPKIFATVADMKRAYERGELDRGDPVKIMNHK